MKETENSSSARQIRTLQTEKTSPVTLVFFGYNQHMYEYGIKYKRTIDGDTFVCDIDLGFGIWLVDQHCRLHGIDTPEKTTAEGKKCVLEAKFWFDDASARLEKFTIQVEAKADKYGRRLVTVRSDKGYCTLNEQLIRDGYAVPYSGGSKLLPSSKRKIVSATPIVTDAP